MTEYKIPCGKERRWAHGLGGKQCIKHYLCDACAEVQSLRSIPQLIYADADNRGLFKGVDPEIREEIAASWVRLSK